MYIVIVCANCNGSSQVEESMLGKIVECPLCRKPTVARTQTAVLPVAKPIEVPAASVQDAPISLDDAVPLPPIQRPRPAAAQASSAKRSPVRTAVYAAISLLLTLLLMGGIYAAFQYGNAQIPDRDWAPFKPPEGDCSIRMPGEPVVEDIPATGPGERGGKRFVVKRWFERVELSVGWMDYDASAMSMRYAQLVQPLRDREMKRMNGRLVGESPGNYRIGNRTIEDRLVIMDLDTGGKGFMHIYFDADPERLRHRIRTELERKQLLLFAPVGMMFGAWLPHEFLVQSRVREIEPGQRIRLWFATAHGRKVTSDLPWMPKFFTSFAPE